MLDLADSDLDSIVDAYETAQSNAGSARVEEFAPPRNHPQYGEIVAELCRAPSTRPRLRDSVLNPATMRSFAISCRG
jgi:hypothetical protein